MGSQRVGHDRATELKFPFLQVNVQKWNCWIMRGFKFVIRSFQTTLPPVMYKFQLFHMVSKCQVFFFNVSLWKFPTSKKVERTVLYWASTYSSATTSLSSLDHVSSPHPSWPNYFWSKSQMSYHFIHKYSILPFRGTIITCKTCHYSS